MPRTSKFQPAMRASALTAVLLFFFVSVRASAQTTTVPLAWGPAGQLGFAKPVTERYPGIVSGLGAGSNVVKLAAGGQSLALKSDGTVLAWGANSVGQLGDGTTITRLTPVSVKDPSGTSNLTGIVDVAVGDGFSLALKSDGTVLAWGAGAALGDGTSTNRLTPVQVVGLGPGSGVVALSGGGHSLALKADGTVLAWGRNVAGELGNGTTTQALAPVPVSGLGPGSGVIAVAASSGSAAYSLALKSDGTVLAWGGNAQGELGDGTTTGKLTPVQVLGLGPGSGIVAIAAGGGPGHSVALLASGSVLTWGGNSFGQLGDGTHNQRLTPAVVPGLGGAVAIGAGGAYTLVLRSDGTVMAWGDNGSGQLGDGTFVERASPIEVMNLSGGVLSGVASIAVAVGGGNNIVLKSDGTVLAWGGNGSGQLGNGEFYGKATPTPIESLEGIVAISSGNAHALALRVDGSVWAWGDNPDGRLGDGTVIKRSTPGQVVGLGPDSGIIAISAGVGASGHNLALKNDGTVLAWGGNLLGGLGDGTRADKWTPIPVDLGPGSRAIKVVASMGSSMVMLADGTVLTWGNNVNAQLGDGHPEFSYRLTPVQVTGLGPGSGVVDIAAGGGHALALKADGTVLAWGLNNTGQLGDGTLTKRFTPVQVSGLGPGSGIVAIFAAGARSGALRSDGTVLGWGTNYVGQLGDGTTTGRSTPGEVVGLGPGSGVVAISVSGGDSLALKSDGQVLAWGDNSAGQLGVGTLEPKLTLVQPIGLGSGSGIVAIAAGGANFAIPRLTITGLTNIVLSLTLNEGIRRALIIKLDAAQRAADRDDDLAALGILEAFANLTEAQRGKALANAEASLLASYSKALMVSMRP